MATRPASRPIPSPTAPLYRWEVGPTLPPNEEGLAIALRGDGYRIGIDAATGVVRVAAVGDSDGRVLASATSPFDVFSDGSRREVDFMAVERAVRSALAEVAEAVPEGSRAISVGIAATASTVAIVDPSDGEPRGLGLMWADHRATREAAAIRDAGHPNLERMLGHVSPEWGIAKLAWLARSDALDASSGIVVELADWLGFRASGSWAANAGTREWGWAGGDDGMLDAGLVEVAGGPASAVERVIPDVLPTGSVLGVVQDVAGWPDAMHGTPVLVGGMDSYLAAVGMGAAAPGRLCLTVGSSSAAIGGLACGDARGRMFGPLRNAVPGLTDGAWQGGQTTAGLAAAWAQSVLVHPDGDLEQAAAHIPPGSRGVTFRETMLDRRNPEPRSPLRGAWTGLGLGHGPGDLYRAVLEGIAFGLADACGGLQPAEVIATGGMLRSDLFRTILADVLKRPIAGLHEETSAAALGAAFADVPERVPGLVRAAATTTPSGADYEEARDRYRRAELPDRDEA
ncbi:MAG TPA: FGGY-family carbohydrate kinase [Candidatus Limnocylindrales bacterium]|nr:FGGY-family carbohydrate kinase [Candidatus Limnocylindrales bacterium]